MFLQSKVPIVRMSRIFYFFILTSLFFPYPHQYGIAALPSTGSIVNQKQVLQQHQQQIFEVIPLEARDFYHNLTSSDRQVLEKVLSKAPNYANIGEILTDLRNGSTTLYEKAVQMVTGLRQTVAKLSPPARSFVDQSVEQFNTAMGQQNAFNLDMLKTQASQLVQRYKSLEPVVKEELRTAFPAVSAIIDNSIVQMLATGLLDIKNDEGKNTGKGEVKEEDFKLIKQ